MSYLDSAITLIKGTFRSVSLATDAIGARLISLAEVSWHDKPTDCWIVIYDRVYDVTDFLDEHPGGFDLLMENAGRDASVAFRGSGHSKFAIDSLEKYHVGVLPMEERIFRKPGGYQLTDIPT